MSSSDGIGGPGPLGGDPFAILEALRSGRIQGRHDRLRAASNLMESHFFQELFKAMRDTVPDSGLLGGRGGEEVFASLLDQHVADAAAARMEGGLGGALYRRLAGLGSSQGAEVPQGVGEGVHGGPEPPQAFGEAVDSREGGDGAHPWKETARVNERTGGR